MAGKAILRAIGSGIVAICCLPLLASAEPLSIRVEPADSGNGALADTHWNVFLEGEIDVGAAERVRRELAQVGKDGTSVYFDSQGGSLVDGLRIGGLLRRLGAATIVGRRGARSSEIESGICLSACSMAFLGGVYRHVPAGSAFGVHRVATTTHSANDFDAGQIVAARVSGYIREMGIDPRLFERMAGAATDRIYVLSPAELRSLRVEYDGRQPAKWWFESSAQGAELIGAQETTGSMGKAVFSCAGGVVVFHSIYQAGGNAGQIASGQWTHSLTIDDTSLPLDAPSTIEDADDFLLATFDLSPDQARRIIGASSIGHSMQGARGDPTSLGYKIDIDVGAAKRVWGFMESCTAFR